MIMAFYSGICLVLESLKLNTNFGIIFLPPYCYAVTLNEKNYGWCMA